MVNARAWWLMCQDGALSLDTPSRGPGIPFRMPTPHAPLTAAARRTQHAKRKARAGSTYRARHITVTWPPAANVPLRKRRPSAAPPPPHTTPARTKQRVPQLHSSKPRSRIQAPPRAACPDGGSPQAQRASRHVPCCSTTPSPAGPSTRTHRQASRPARPAGHVYVHRSRLGRIAPCRTDIGAARISLARQQQQPVTRGPASRGAWAHGPPTPGDRNRGHAPKQPQECRAAWLTKRRPFATAKTGDHTRRVQLRSSTVFSHGHAVRCFTVMFPHRHQQTLKTRLAWLKTARPGRRRGAVGPQLDRVTSLWPPLIAARE